MALNQIPYTNVHELNIDWMLEQLKDFDRRLSEIEDYGDEIAALQSAVRSLETALQQLKTTTQNSLLRLNERCTALEDNDDLLQRSIDLLYQSVAQDISDIVSQFDAINASLRVLRAYNDTSNTVILSEAKAYTRKKVQELLEYFLEPKMIYVTNPWTNEIVTIQEFINYLYDLLHYAGLTCFEFEALNLTCQAFDDLGLTAEEFDNYGRWAMFFRNAYVTRAEVQEMLEDYATLEDIEDMATKEDLEHYATLNDIRVIDPCTGILGDMQTALISLAALHQNNVTVDQFEAMELDCTTFDSLDLTAFVFDFHGLITFINLNYIAATTGITAEQWAAIVVGQSGQLFTTVF